MSWTEWAAQELRSLETIDRLRRTVAFDGDGPRGVVAGRSIISFASNDYLGLASHPRVRAAAHAAIDRYGAGAMASRLIVGTRSLHHELEAALARWKSCESALVFSSGFATNVGVLSTLGAADVTVFSDALNHASIIDGCRLARARTQVYRHNDVAHLAALMGATRGRKIVATESVFSMDGDRAPIDQLAELCKEHAALLVLDEAHDALGDCDAHDVEILRVGTLSKTLGALGGFVAGPKALIDLLVNRARTFIFTTGLSPADAAAALAALEIVTGEEGARLRARLGELIDLLRPGHGTAIIPVIIGAEAAALQAAQHLLQQGIHVPAIRPPTVAPGTSRLRIALSASHTPSMVQRLREALDSLPLCESAASFA
ncbi:MAG: 8-amino-7-oxononanoate synthase [Steroidobacteraceae bacterium]|jgi:8-amino-7-oxononanoate synthase|nr:8-amino-7-oxononanoate synthase [Steroidobacteraceae bacterium]